MSILAYSEKLKPNKASNKEGPITLSEPSSTLNVLFKFLGRDRFPDLSSTPFEALEAIAIAAEKYKIYSAMTPCVFYMEFVLLEPLSKTYINSRLAGRKSHNTHAASIPMLPRAVTVGF